MNDLLQRKPTWNGPDVLRFTELVQQEHENERAEAKAKAEMEAGEEAVERGFSGAFVRFFTEMQSLRLA